MYFGISKDNSLISTYQEPVLTKNVQVGFVAIITNGFLNHVLKLASLLLIFFDFLQ